MDLLKRNYENAHRTLSDINMHVPVLKTFASCCTSVLELGTRECVSSWGFLMGLVSNPYTPPSEKSHFANDLSYHPNIDKVERIAHTLGINYEFFEKNDLALDIYDIPLPYIDMVFIDTWHIYGQLRRELKKFAPLTRKYIVLHDTDIDGAVGETIRLQQDVSAMASASGYSTYEVGTGLTQAIDEFITANNDWFILVTIADGIGLTVLARRGVTIDAILGSKMS